ncbi:MAG: hypothetical protein ABIN01_06970 [Ferruginibacter sp.]
MAQICIELFNIADATHDVSIDFASLGLKGKVTVRDLWKKADLGVFNKQFKQSIKPHDSMLLRLTVK